MRGEGPRRSGEYQTVDGAEAGAPLDPPPRAELGRELRDLLDTIVAQSELALHAMSHADACDEIARIRASALRASKVAYQLAATFDEPQPAASRAEPAPARAEREDRHERVTPLLVRRRHDPWGRSR